MSSPFVLPLRQDPFPHEAARDLLGVLRAVQAATPARERVTHKHLRRLVHELEQACWRGRESKTGTQMHAGAWAAAENVAKTFMDYVDPFLKARELVKAAVDRCGC
jgi:phosphopantetheinyl transferase (holo-ACP synthase)